MSKHWAKKKVWKWVAREPWGTLESVLVTLPDILVQYGTDFWAEPPRELLEKGYGLCVFESKEAALLFRRCLWFGDEAPKPELWEAEAEDVWVPEVPPATLLVLEGRFVFYPEEDKVWPEGTLMARRVRLLRKIYPEEEVSHVDSSQEP